MRGFGGFEFERFQCSYSPPLVTVFGSANGTPDIRAQTVNIRSISIFGDSKLSIRMKVLLAPIIPCCFLSLAGSRLPLISFTYVSDENVSDDE